MPILFREQIECQFNNVYAEDNCLHLDKLLEMNIFQTYDWKNKFHFNNSN